MGGGGRGRSPITWDANDMQMTLDRIDLLGGFRRVRMRADAALIASGAGLTLTGCVYACWIDGLADWRMNGLADALERAGNAMQILCKFDRAQSQIAD